MLLIYLSTTSSSVLEVKFLDKLLEFLWVRAAHSCYQMFFFTHTSMKGDITKVLQFNKTFRYIDDLLCVNNDNFN